MAFLFHLLGDVVGDGAHLGGVGTVAHHEEIRDGAVNLTQVKRNYIQALLIQNRVGNQPQVVCDHIGILFVHLHKYTQNLRQWKV